MKPFVINVKTKLKGILILNMGVYTLMLPPPSLSGEIKDQEERKEKGGRRNRKRRRGNVKGRIGKRIGNSREEERLGREKVGMRKGTVGKRLGKERWGRGKVG